MARILYIEDDANSRLLVRKVLTAAGHEMFEAERGLDGVRRASEVRPDLVLVDINVPDLDGYEIALRLRGISHLAGVPIVAVTAEGDRSTSYAVGCDGFVEKPIDVATFPTAVSEFLAGRRDSGEASLDAPLRVASQRIVEHLEAKVAALSEANQKLEELARLRREFLRNLSHELATPLTPALGYLRLLLQDELGPLTEVQRKSLVAVDASISRLRGLIDTLLDVSSLETGRMHFFGREYDFAKNAKRVLDEAKPRFVDRQIELVFQNSKQPMPAFGDPEKVRRAMAHLIDNAAKFTPKGGAVAVDVTALEGEGAPNYRFRVGDSGPGVAKESLGAILDVFYQADGSVTRQFGGVGLGLAFVRRVSEAHGGEILVESPPTEPVAEVPLGGTAVSLVVKARANLVNPPAS